MLSASGKFVNSNCDRPSQIAIWQATQQRPCWWCKTASRSWYSNL